MLVLNSYIDGALDPLLFILISRFKFCNLKVTTYNGLFKVNFNFSGTSIFFDKMALNLYKFKHFRQLQLFHQSFQRPPRDGGSEELQGPISPSLVTSSGKPLSRSGSNASVS